MNKIQYYIKEIEKNFLINFKPTRDFYKKVGIGQKRFGMLLKNETSATIDELENLKSYFGLKDINQLIEKQ